VAEQEAPIQLANVNRIWKVALVDDLESPKIKSVLIIRKCATLFAVLNEVKKMPGYVGFREKFPNVEIVSVEYAGRSEN